MSLSLAEELLLLALKDEKGTVVLAASAALPYGLAGAVLMDLILQKKIRLDGKRVAAADGMGPKDSILLACWQLIQEKEKPRTIRHWIDKFGRTGKIRNRCLERLVSEEILRLERRKVLLIFPGRRFPTADPRPETEARKRLRRAVLEGKPADNRTMMLLSLVRACDLIGEVFPGPEKKDARKKIKAMVSDEAIGNAVAAEIEEILTAVIIASTVSSVAASS